jgi:hypothetical protein
MKKGILNQFIVFSAFILLVFSGFSQAVTIEPNGYQENLGKYLEILEDKS